MAGLQRAGRSLLSRFTLRRLVCLAMAMAAGGTLAVESFGVLRPLGVDGQDPRFSTAGEHLLLGGRPFSGWRIERYPNGEDFTESHYARGLQEGEMREYGFSHRLRALSHFRSGKKHGVQTEWQPDGALFRRRVFQNGFEAAL